MKWFKKHRTAIEAPKLIFPQGYSLDEFRSNKILSEEARKFFLETQLGGHILAVLHNSAPRGFPLRGQDVNPTSAAVELGRMQGYADALIVVAAICSYAGPGAEIEADYGQDAIFEKEMK
jgi:hypothetical protein